MEGSSAEWSRSDLVPLGIRLRHPDSWVVVTDDRPVAMLVDPSSTSFRPNMMISVERVDDLDGYTAQAVEEMTMFLTDLRVGEPSTAEVAGARARRLSSTYRQGRFELRLEQWIVPRAEDILVISATWEPATTPGFERDMEAVVTGLELV